MMSDLSLTKNSASFMQLQCVGVWNEKFRHAWAVILAGGDGTRLRSVSLRVAGDARPKQFCNLLGRGSLLSETRKRISRTIPAEQQLFVVTRAHEQWYRQDLGDIHPARLLVQPQNRGTGVAIALGVLRVLQEDPQATVVFLPSDHFYSDDDAFLSALQSAMSLSETFPESIVLLGAKATHAEVEYGWIEPHSLVPHRAIDGVFRVKQFWEKPARVQADELLGRGCFWNTFVTVGQATTFLDILCTQIPTTILQILKGLAGQNIQAAYDWCSPSISPGMC